MNKLKMIIIALFQWLKCYHLGTRLKQWFNPKKDCRYCCLFCEYFDACAIELSYTFAEYNGYKIFQNISNKIILVYDENNDLVFSVFGKRLLSKRELRGQIKYYLERWKPKEVEE